MKFIDVLSIAGAALCLFANPATRADDVYIWAEETGGNVIFYHEGSIDLTGLPVAMEVLSGTVIGPSFGAYANGGININIYANTLPDGSMRTFGSGGVTDADSTAGDILGLGSDDELGLGIGYTSGAPISGSMTFLSTTLAALGVDPTPFSFNTLVGANTIHLFTVSPAVLAERAAAKADLQRKIRKLQKKAKKLKKKGKKAKAKKLLKKVKKLKQQLAALG